MADKALDRLTFLDLLYAVAVTDLAIRVANADLPRVPAVDWSVLAVILTVIVLSWIGLHKNRTAMAEQSLRPDIGQIQFASPRFFQFLLEIVITMLYFAMGLELKFPIPKDPDLAAAPEEWITGFLLAIFFAYLLWDALDVGLANKTNETTANPWQKRATAGMNVTAVAFVLSMLLFAYILLARPGNTVVCGINFSVIIALWLYRVAQDRWGNTKTAPQAATT